MLMVALLMGAMVSCNNNGGSSSSKTSKSEDSISTELGTMIGKSLKMQMSQDPRTETELDKAELLRGIEAVLSCDTTKRGKSYLNGLAVALQMIYPSISQMEGQGINIDRKAFINELKKGFNSKDSIKMEEMQSKQSQLMAMVQRVVKAKGEENIKKGKKYIEEQVKKDKGFKKTNSGIAYKVITPGKGANFNDSATVDVTYVGKHIDGKEFDNSNGKPIPFNLKQTVPGFREVLTNMNEGAKVIAIIPGELAYGEQGNPQGGIAPNETLVFEMTAVGLHKDEPSAMPGRPANIQAAPKAAPKAASKAAPKAASKAAPKAAKK